MNNETDERNKMDGPGPYSVALDGDNNELLVTDNVNMTIILRGPASNKSAITNLVDAANNNLKHRYMSDKLIEYIESTIITSNVNVDIESMQDVIDMSTIAIDSAAYNGDTVVSINCDTGEIENGHKPECEPEARAGWRYFICDNCGQKWDEASRDRTSQSGVDCSCCGEWVRPTSSISDVVNVQVDELGNLKDNKIIIYFTGTNPEESDSENEESVGKVELDETVVEEREDTASKKVMPYGMDLLSEVNSLSLLWSTEAEKLANEYRRKCETDVSMNFRVLRNAFVTIRANLQKLESENKHLLTDEYHQLNPSCDSCTNFTSQAPFYGYCDKLSAVVHERSLCVSWSKLKPSAEE